MVLFIDKIKIHIITRNFLKDSLRYLPILFFLIFLLVFGIIVGVVMIAITCFACPEEPLLEKPPDAKNPIVELINTIKNIPRSALIADIFFIMNSAMTYEKGCWESHFFATTIYKG